jgi:hypothetical protein
MLVGYNTNVPYKGTLYHVQTEDNGLKNPVIVTLLYIKGTILSSKKISYADIVSNPDCKEKVRELMKEQHKTMMKELISGKHTSSENTPSPDNQPGNKPDIQPGKPDITGTTSPAAPAAAAAQTPKEQSEPPAARSLDDILLDFIIKKGT